MPQLFLCLFLIASCGSANAQPFLYVANQNANSLSVVDTRTNTVTASPGAGFSPAALALSPDGTRLFVSNPNSNLVTVYNTATNALVSSFPIGQLPVGLAVDNARIYVALQGNAAVAVFSAATSLQQASIRVGFGPSALAFAPATNRLYVANTYSSSLSVIDPTRIGTAANPVVATIPVPDSPIALAVSPDGLTAWVASSAIPTLARVNLAQDTVENRVPLPLSPAGLAVSEDQSRAYVTGYGPQVATVDLRGASVLSTIALPACPLPRCVAMSAAVSSDGKLVYIANTSVNQIVVLNAESGEIAARINTGASPRAIVLGPAPRPMPTSLAETLN